MSLFGEQQMNRVRPPIQAANGIAIASIEDIFGMKCSAVQGRGSHKDYEDIATILTCTTLTLSDGMGFAREIYGKEFNLYPTLKALSDYDNLDESLDDKYISVLAPAVINFDYRSYRDGPDQAAPGGSVLFDQPDRGFER